MRIERAHAAVLAAAFVASIGCGPKESTVPPIPERDAGPRPDTGPVPPVGHGRIDAGTRDAGRDVEDRDGGVVEEPIAITIDGVVDADEWAAAVSAEGGSGGGGEFALDALTRLLAVRDGDRLFIAIEGALQPDHAIIAYVDVDYGDGTGTILDGTSLLQFGTLLETAISKTLYAVDAELQIDLAFATTAMPFQAGAAMGWADVSVAGQPFGNVTGDDARCSLDACEASVALPSGTGEIAIFVRLAVTDQLDIVSNLTLPLDDPQYVSELLFVP